MFRLTDSEWMWMGLNSKLRNLMIKTIWLVNVAWENKIQWIWLFL